MMIIMMIIMMMIMIMVMICLHTFKPSLVYQISY